MVRRRAAGVTRKRLFEGRWRLPIGSFTRLRLVVHLVVIIGLLGTLVGAQQAEAYFTRGVAEPTDLAPIPWTAGSPMGINTFLNEEADPAIVERSLDMIAAGGYRYIRQLFGWFEIEPEPGVYVDQAGRSTWEKYDRIVNLAHEGGIEVIARLDKPPLWARAGAEQPEIAGPPDRLEDFGNFVSQVTTRYEGKLRFVQIWNEPNLEGEWGGEDINPAGYVDLLEVGYRAAKAANPDVVVLMAGLAPTDQLGPHNLSDLIFMQRVYDHGGAAFFDIAAVMVYGYGYSPFDRRLNFGRNNFSRPVQTREIMVRNGDADTPIWAVEYGWVSLPDDWHGQPSPWGEPISEERRAEYLVQGYLRAQREWPWMGTMAVWSFRFPRPADAPDQVGNPTRGFTIVDHDFEPKPAYRALDEASSTINRLGTGAYELTNEQHTALRSGQPISLQILGSSIAVRATGTGVLAVTVEGAGERAIDVNAPDDSRQVLLIDDLDWGTHDVVIRFGDDSVLEGLRIEQVVIWSDSIHLGIYPWIDGALAVVLGLNLASLGWVALDRRRSHALTDRRRVFESNITA